MTKLVNRAKMTTASTGTGSPITLGSAVDGYQTFAAAGVADADVVRYVIEDGVNWEIGTGTYTASGTTLSRTVSESSNADAAINLSGDAVVYVTATAEDFAAGGGSVDVQEFTTSGTWTKPAGATVVKVELWGAGGGGGSGRVGAAGTNRTGGSAGGGGAYAFQTFDAADLGSTETVTIGAGGAGGAAITTDNTNGLNGSNGGNTTFGTYLTGFGGGAGLGGNTTNRNAGGGGGRLSAGSLNGTKGQPSSITTVFLYEIFGGGQGGTSNGQNSVYGGSAGGGTTTASSTSGGVSIYAGGGANAGGGIRSTDEAFNNSSGFVQSNFFGLNALGGVSAYLKTTPVSNPSVIGANVFLPSSNGLLSYSSDLSSWTTVNPSFGALYNIKSDGTNYLLTSAGGVYKSTDLSTWTDVGLSSDITWADIEFSGGTYVAVGWQKTFGVGSPVAYSTDLVNWSYVSSIGTTGGYWGSVKHDGTYFVISGGGGGGFDLAYSNNGSSWTQTAIPSGVISSVGGFAVNGSTWLARTYDGSFNPTVFRSTDQGATWTSVLVTSGVYHSGLSYANGNFILTTNSSTLYYSTDDGVTWSSSVSTGTVAYGVVLFSGSLVYGGNTVTYLTSTTSYTSFANFTLAGVGANGTNGANGLTASGGGGGAAATNGFTSGAGGNGGNGLARITSW